MSLPTTPCFVTKTKGWEQARAHPTMAWMEKYTAAFNDPAQLRDASFADWHTADTEHVNSDGREFNGFPQVHAAIQEIYAPFAQYLHEPSWLSVWDTPNGGWEMVGTATMFANLAVPGETKAHTSLDGQKWELAMPGMFHFWYVKDPSAKHGGIKMARSEVYSDTLGAVQEMMKRGMIKA